MAEKVPKSQRVYRSLLNRNVHPFIVIFFEECFLRGAIFSKVALLRPENEHEFSRFSICYQLYCPKDTKRNVLDLADF